MREIKFRVWDKINKKLDRNRTGFISDQGGFYVDADPHGVDMSGQRRICMRPNQYELAGQCTGMLDKQGKEIYEGDLVTHKYPGIWKVFYDPPNFRLRRIDDGAGDRLYMQSKHVKVIGNIFETKNVDVYTESPTNVF